VVKDAFTDSPRHPPRDPGALLLSAILHLGNTLVLSLQTEKDASSQLFSGARSYKKKMPSKRGAYSLNKFLTGFY